MAQRHIYTVEIGGKQYDIEGDHAPSEEEARAAVKGSAPTPAPATTTLSQGFNPRRIEPSSASEVKQNDSLLGRTVKALRGENPVATLMGDLVPMLTSLPGVVKGLIPTAGRMTGRAGASMELAGKAAKPYSIPLAVADSASAPGGIGRKLAVGASTIAAPYAAEAVGKGMQGAGQFMEKGPSWMQKPPAAVVQQEMESILKTPPKVPEPAPAPRNTQGQAARDLTANPERRIRPTEELPAGMTERRLGELKQKFGGVDLPETAGGQGAVEGASLTPEPVPEAPRTAEDFLNAANERLSNQPEFDAAAEAQKLGASRESVEALSGLPKGELSSQQWQDLIKKQGFRETARISGISPEELEVKSGISAAAKRPIPADAQQRISDFAAQQALDRDH